MIDLEKIKLFIDYLIKSKIPREKGFELLRKEKTLNKDEKNIIFVYCYPKPYGDMELTYRIQDYREKHGRNINNIGESILILEASQTEQYERFIKHLLHSFIVDTSKVVNVEEKDKTCSLCGEKIGDINLPYSKGFSSMTSNIILCEHCLSQLFRAKEFLDVFDPSFLDWTKKWKLATKK